MHLHLLQRLAELGDARELVLGPADRAALIRRSDGAGFDGLRGPSVVVRAQLFSEGASTAALAPMLAIGAVAGPATTALLDMLGPVAAPLAAELPAWLAELRTRELNLDSEVPAPVFVAPSGRARDNDRRPSGPDHNPILPVDDLTLSAAGAHLVLRSRRLRGT
ncbi:hypothetical protein [Nannocystis pusilla]|uniref:hypothetical protein n=1 Tax=Nannocystis pusilla TaxID=889268 RepID=UPI003B773F92